MGDQMPYPNEHSARLQDPDKFDSFGRTKGGKLYGGVLIVPATIGVIWGHPKGGPVEAAIPQALRFPISAWTEAEAKKWLKDNDVKYISFEAAKELQAMTVKELADPEVNDLIPR
jgi:hypothetical protein